MLPFLILLLAAGQVAPPADSAAPPGPRPAAPAGVKTFDTPNDQGKSITLQWSAGDALATAWLVERTGPEGPKVVSTNAAGQGRTDARRVPTHYSPLPVKVNLQSTAARRPPCRLDSEPFLAILAR